jgi:hypothetical protein
MVAVANAGPAEITEEEKQNLADLMARLGLWHPIGWNRIIKL